ncbi:ferredoxin [Streptomyces sp. NPDC002588]|uniref:ferredoxin n=1 Tax=Streptomyces sp. NPDC002588 TaxID=3154419 RepID=UPI00332C3515
MSVDVSLCYGTGQCAETAPEVFAQDLAGGTVELRTTAPPVELAEDVRHAALFCPSGSIRIIGEEPR